MKNQITVVLVRDWVDLYTVAGAPAAGTKIRIQNQSDSIMRLSSKATVPTLSDPASLANPLSYASNDSGDTNAWAYGSGVILVEWD